MNLRFLVLAVLLSGCAEPAVVMPSPAPPPAVYSPLFGPISQNHYGESVWVCAGPVPRGWAISNIRWKNGCGNRATWQLVNLNGALPGSEVAVCSNSPDLNYAGWKVVNHFTSTTSCGQPPRNVRVMVKR